MEANAWTVGRTQHVEASTRWDERHLARLAGAHDGIVEIGELTALGLTREGRRWRIAQRRLIPIYRGVYAVGHGELTERGRFRAAVLACGDGAVLSHLAAARLLGLWEREIRTVDVTVPKERRPRARNVRVHRASLTSPYDVTHVRGIPCCSPSRLLVDLANTPQLEAVFERAERRRLVRPHLIEETLHNRPGAARVRRLLATHRPKSGATRSLLERMLLGELRRRQMPEPMVNGELRLNGLTLEPDLMWPVGKVLVELDGHGTHATPTARRRDAKRDRMAVLNGWTPLRFTWADVEQDQRGVVADILAALTA